MKDATGIEYEVYDNKKILFMLNNSHDQDAIICTNTATLEQKTSCGYIFGARRIGRMKALASGDDTIGIITIDGNDEMRCLMDTLYELKRADEKAYAEKPILIQSQLLSFAHFDWCMNLGFRVYIGRWHCTKESFKEQEINNSYKLNVLEIKPSMTEDNKEIRWAHNISRLIVAGHFDQALHTIDHDDYLNQLRVLYDDCQNSEGFQNLLKVIGKTCHVSELPGLTINEETGLFDQHREVVEYEEMTDTFELRRV